ncbi:Aste57867_19348 [Aphanomyces stellatus]|uniref:Aste57867_19348 protein n=1 Tax=Aphanomyces stellatus TaxID=120398 RepID=A0A485LGK6_9STRA|nr:hypothetical protein As57867_019284 [Aphanomyces stellatus]VFT96062.1 Aste57867_19348 [Aphanomyces stellatus]
MSSTKGVEMTGVKSKEYTPLLDASATKTTGSDELADTRPLSEIIASLKESLESKLHGDIATNSLMHLTSLNRALRAKREYVESLDIKKSEDRWTVSFEAEARTKHFLFAEKEYEDLLQDAVKSEVADLLVRMIRARLHDDATLVLLNELSSGGFIFVQNALYYASTDSQPAFLAFLANFLKDESASSTTALAILQQLCVYHHSQWQAVMRVPVGVDQPSFLTTILGRVASVNLTHVTAADTTTLVAMLNFLAEACQGPSVENQLVVSDATALAVVRDVVLVDTVHFDAAVDTAVQIQIQRAAAEVILTLMEGRVDTVVHERLAALLPVATVVAWLQKQYHAIQDKLQSASRRTIMSLLSSDSRDDVMRQSREFRAAINVLRIVTHLLHDKHPDTTPAASFVSFCNGWKDVLANGKVHDAVAFFQDKLISVEITRAGTTFTTYFLRPKGEKFFNKTLKTKLLDEMDIGSESALDVLASEVAKDVEEELAVIQFLDKNMFYSLMNNWNVWLRTNMLYLCFYINFVMLLCVQVDNSKMVDIQTANMHSGLWVVGVLGFVLLTFCAVLWFYHLLTTFSFNYCKQQASSFKLAFATAAELRKETFYSFASFGVNLQFFFAIFAVIWYMDLVTVMTKAFVSLGALYLVGSFLSAVRRSNGLYRFTINVDARAHTNIFMNVVTFWYNVVYDTLVDGKVLTFGFYTLCAICALGLSIPSVTDYFDAGPWGLMFFGFPLVDILATNEQLRFVVRSDCVTTATAMQTNLSKLGVTAIFGAIMIYIFSLVGFFTLQNELKSEDGTDNHCTTLLQCYSTYIRYGLLSGGGIGDYISSSLNHELDYSDPTHYVERLVYDLAFYVVVITLFLNMIQGIIIDAFTSVREQAETKAALKRERCLVCNRSRTAIELEGVENGLLNNFGRHTQVEHNLFNYFFYIQHVSAKDPKELNGIESFVVEKLKTKDMSWIPRV